MEKKKVERKIVVKFSEIFSVARPVHRLIRQRWNKLSVHAISLLLKRRCRQSRARKIPAQRTPAEGTVDAGLLRAPISPNCWVRFDRRFKIILLRAVQERVGETSREVVPYIILKENDICRNNVDACAQFFVLQPVAQTTRLECISTTQRYSF